MNTRRFSRKCTGFVVAVLTVLCAVGCADEPFDGHTGRSATGAQPVRLTVSCAPMHSVADTRSAPVERTWQEGDKIHIWTEFDIEGGETKKTYACYTYTLTDDWQPANALEDNLMWPIGSTRGRFTAYYLSGLDGRLSDQDAPEFQLGDIAEGGDPLKAEYEGTYGHSVALDFRHLCTHLTVADVKSDISDVYWLFSGEGQDDFPNAYKLTYDKENGLKFEFTKDNDYMTGTSHYVSRKRPDKALTTVDFYLAQEQQQEGGVKYKYGNSQLTYRFGNAYLSFQDFKQLDNLEAGWHYEFSINNQLGIVPVAPTEFPDEPDPKDLELEVDIPTLLEGMRDGTDVYDTKNETLVFKADGEAIPYLLHDVNFRKFNPQDYIEGRGQYEGQPHPNWQLPIFKATLNGNYHSFVDVAFPIFDKIDGGQIDNLAIRDSECEMTHDKFAGVDTNKMRGSLNGGSNSDFGLLCFELNGQISNILVENVSIEVDMGYKEGVGNQVNNIGGLAGWIQSDFIGEGVASVSDIDFRGAVKLNVNASDGLSASQDCYVGILAGQCANGVDGIVCTKSPDSQDARCTVTCGFQTRSNICLGGLVGKLSSEMQRVAFAVKVDASELVSGQAYVGGMVGYMSNESAHAGSLTNSSAGVEVSGGTVQSIDAVTYSHCETGGIAGRIHAVTVSEVQVTGSVVGGAEAKADEDNGKRFNYATGGAFGYVSGNELSVVKGCNSQVTVTPAMLATQNVWGNSTGGFVGLSESKDEEALSAEGNTARPQGGMNFVGRVDPEPAASGGKSN